MYYVLLEKQPGERWTIQFSDEDRETVEDERYSYEEYNDAPAGTRPIYKVIAVRNDRQATIDAAVAKLNAKGI